MKASLHAVRREKDTVALVKIVNAVAKADRAAAIHAQQHPETHGVSPVGHLLPALGVYKHSIDFKKLTPAQKL